MRMNVRDLTAAFNHWYRTLKTETAIRSALANHHIRCGRAHKNRLIETRLRIFTETQIRFLRDNYPGRSLRDLAGLFNLVFNDTKTVLQIRSAVHNRGITSGRTGYFPKGNKPWNAGTRGEGLTGRNKTTFEKGNIPPNRKPLGSERITRDGYIEIKIGQRDPYTGFPTRYRLKHVHIWEEANGPVPAGHCLIFADGNSLNCEPGNLLLVSRAELLLLNQYGYKTAPAEIKPSILALARLKASAFSKQKMHKRSGS
jgi:hypothetical protein